MIEHGYVAEAYYNRRAAEDADRYHLGGTVLGHLTGLYPWIDPRQYDVTFGPFLVHIKNVSSDAPEALRAQIARTQSRIDARLPSTGVADFAADAARQARATRSRHRAVTDEELRVRGDVRAIGLLQGRFDADRIVWRLFDLILRLFGAADKTFTRWADNFSISELGQDLLDAGEKIGQGVVDWLGRIFDCRIPRNIAGRFTRGNQTFEELYSPFCLPLLYEGLYQSGWFGPFPNGLIPLQVPWPAALIKRDCKKVFTGNNRLFTFKQHSQCRRGARQTTTEPACLASCCTGPEARCDLARPETLNTLAASRCLRQCCEFTPGCRRVQNCGFVGDARLAVLANGTEIRGLGLACDTTSDHPVCIQACCIDTLGPRLCNPLVPESLDSDAAAACLRTCCAGYPVYEGAPAPTQCQPVPACGFEQDVGGPGTVRIKTDCIFPYCDSSDQFCDYCKREYFTCAESGFSDILDVVLFLVASVPWIVEFVVKGGIRARALEPVVLWVTTFTLGGIALATFVLFPVALVLFNLFGLGLLWIVARTFALENDVIPFVFFVLAGVTLLYAFGLERILKEGGGVLWIVISVLLFAVVVSLFTVVPDNYTEIFNIVGGLIASVKWMKTRNAFAWLPLDDILFRLRQYDYVELGGIPSLHYTCALTGPWAFTGWGTLTLLLVAGTPFLTFASEVALATFLLPFSLAGVIWDFIQQIQIFDVERRSSETELEIKNMRAAIGKLMMSRRGAPPTLSPSTEAHIPATEIVAAHQPDNLRRRRRAEQ